jgi:hypothetical protein
VLSLADDGSVDPLGVCASTFVQALCVVAQNVRAFGIARTHAYVLRVDLRLWMATDAPLLHLSLHRRALVALH